MKRSDRGIATGLLYQTHKIVKLKWEPGKEREKQGEIANEMLKLHAVIYSLNPSKIIFAKATA